MVVWIKCAGDSSKRRVGVSEGVLGLRSTSMGNIYVVRWLFRPRLVVEDRIREQLLESHNVFVGDVLVEVLIVEWPRSRPQSSKVPKWYWRNGVLFVLAT